jgi:hypothetical protein
LSVNGTDRKCREAGKADITARVPASVSTLPRHMDRT